MNSEFNLQEVESRLAECVTTLRLRDILANAGIPADESIKLSLKCGGKDIVQDIKIPTICPSTVIEKRPIDLAEEIKCFLNLAEREKSLLGMLPQNESSPSFDGTTETIVELTIKRGILKFGDEEFSRQEIRFRNIICCPCFPGAGFCCVK